MYEGRNNSHLYNFSKLASQPFVTLSNEAVIYLCQKERRGPVYKAFRNVHDSIVHLLPSGKQALINSYLFTRWEMYCAVTFICTLCMEDGAIPLYTLNVKVDMIALYN